MVGMSASGLVRDRGFAERRLFLWLAFCAASGAGNEVPNALLRPCIVEWIIKVLGSVSRGVMKQHTSNAAGALENRTDTSDPHPQNLVERRPDRPSHPERLSHWSQNGRRVRVSEDNSAPPAWLRKRRFIGHLSSQSDLLHRVNAADREL
jgi:hypothetical protein